MSDNDDSYASQTNTESLSETLAQSTGKRTRGGSDIGRIRKLKKKEKKKDSTEDRKERKQTEALSSAFWQVKGHLDKQLLKPDEHGLAQDTVQVLYAALAILEQLYPRTGNHEADVGFSRPIP